MRKALTATRDMTYATRRLKAGAEFTASRRDADILVRLGRAQYAVPKELVEDLGELRALYLKVIGKRPYHGWGPEVLREKIEASS